MNKLICTLLLLFSTYCTAYEYTLSICAIFQNEAPYLKEWIDYHESHGVDHFLLYNNNSTDNYLEVLVPYINRGYVELIQWPSIQQESDWQNFTFTTQTGAYNDGLNRLRGTSKWVALIDTDEFIVTKCVNIAHLLENDYPQVSGLCVNWQCYGTSGVKNCKSILKELTMKMKWDHDWNKNSKSIVQPLHVITCPNPHFCTYLSTHWAIDSKGNKCDACPSGVYIDKIRINHYWTRDEWFLYNIKLPRYAKWIGNNEKDHLLQHAESMNQEYDPILSMQ